MNSLDAIIALCVLLCSFAILLGIIGQERTQLEDSSGSIAAKIGAINCATIIDSMFVNNAGEYQGELNCGARGNELARTINGQTKSAKTLTSVEKKENLEVRVSEHYKN